MEVIEYRPTKLSLDQGDLDYLLSLVRSATGDRTDARVLHALTPTHAAGVYEVTPGPYVGRLGLPSGRWIDFRSRFPFEDVIELIRRSARHPIRADKLRVDAHAETFLTEAIALAFSRELESLVGQGLAKGYERIRHQRPPYPGRLDTAYHLGRLAARPDRLVTVGRHLITNVPVNQALAVALDTLTRVPLAREVSTRLARLVPAFVRVTRAPIRAEDVGRITLTNLTRRYQQALALAEAILRSQSLAPRSTGLASGSLLFFMPKVWEAYVSQWLAEQWPEHRVDAPHRFQLTNDGQTAEADATVWNGDELVALYDAKYKWPGSTPDRGDIYQMVTYCERLGLQHSTLVYPVAAPKLTVTVGNKAVHVLGVTPSFAPLAPSDDGVATAGS
ncbi:5-methylcytosine-specific restriction enzyme subunit McrC [Micromonospora jinlongensis]|uniref:5-methylcytosine-specific restriction enzyme subunit McrC n=1 Tax=Micromonospora jinlongensis TaxID=1287877 RepID=A0A7Y9X4B4_9ACTN|nr:5-methylcytosine-specific restriction enzyme subunit McrC [Micromonospora jinlongensis]